MKDIREAEYFAFHPYTAESTAPKLARIIYDETTKSFVLKFGVKQ